VNIIKLLSDFNDDPYDGNDDDDDDEIWMIVGITIGVIGIIVAIVLSIIYCPRKMKKVKVSMC